MPNLLKFTLICALLLAAAPSAVHAQAKNQARLDAQKRVTEAQENLKVIKEDETRFRDKYVAEYSQKEEWKTTIAEHKKAKANFDKVQKSALTAMKSKPEYKAAVKDRDAVKVKLDAAKEPDEITKLGSDLAKKALLVKNMEKEAHEQDPKVLEAKEALAAAEKELKAMNEDIDGALESDPDYTSVKQRLDDAELQVTQAKEALNLQVKAEAQARKSSRPASTPRTSSRRSSKYD